MIVAMAEGVGVVVVAWWRGRCRGGVGVPRGHLDEGVMIEKAGKGILSQPGLGRVTFGDGAVCPENFSGKEV